MSASGANNRARSTYSGKFETQVRYTFAVPSVNHLLINPGCRTHVLQESTFVTACIVEWVIVNKDVQ